MAQRADGASGVAPLRRAASAEEAAGDAAGGATAVRRPECGGSGCWYYEVEVLRDDVDVRLGWLGRIGEGVGAGGVGAGGVGVGASAGAAATKDSFGAGATAQSAVRSTSSFFGFDFASKVWAADGDALEGATSARLPSYAKKGDYIGCLLDLEAGVMRVRVLSQQATGSGARAQAQLRLPHAWARIAPGGRGAAGDGGDADDTASDCEGGDEGALGDGALEEMAAMLLGLGGPRAQRLGDRLRYVSGEHCETGFASLRRSWRGLERRGEAPRGWRRIDVASPGEGGATLRRASAGAAARVPRAHCRARGAESVFAPFELSWETDAARDVRGGGLGVVGGTYHGRTVLSTSGVAIDAACLSPTAQWSTRVSVPFSGSAVVTLALQIDFPSERRGSTLSLPSGGRPFASELSRLCIGVCAASAAKAFCGSPEGDSGDVHRCAPIRIASDGRSAEAARSVLYCINGEAWDSVRGAFVAPRLDGGAALAPGATRTAIVQLCIDADRGRVRVIPDHYTGPDLVCEGLLTRGAMRLVVGVFGAQSESRRVVIVDVHSELRSAIAACDVRSIAWRPPLQLWGRRCALRRSVASAAVRDGCSAGCALNPIVTLSTPIRAHGEVAVRVVANDAARDASAAPGLLRIGFCDASDSTLPNWLARDRAELGGSDAAELARQLLPTPRWCYQSGGLVVDASLSPPHRALTVARPCEQDLAVGTVVRFVFDAARRSATVWLTTRGGGDERGGAAARRAADGARRVREIVALSSPQRGGADDTLIATLADVPRHVRLFAVMYSAAQELRFMDVVPCGVEEAAARLRGADVGGWACGDAMGVVGVSVAPASSPRCRVLSYRTRVSDAASSVGARLTAPITLQPGRRHVAYVRWSAVKTDALPTGATVVAPSAMCIGVCTAKFNRRWGGGWVCGEGPLAGATAARLGDDAGGESVALVSSGVLMRKGAPQRRIPNRR